MHLQFKQVNSTQYLVLQEGNADFFNFFFLMIFSFSMFWNKN